MKPLLPTNHQLQTVNTNWKAAGVAIPVFSLRSENSFGIGEFSDIKKLVDWAYTTKQKVIQVLPINDTTMTYTGADASPYSAITIYGLHPIYLGLQDYPLKNEELKQKYRTEALKLNNLPEVDYEKVMKLKVAYLKDLFTEIGRHTLEDKDFLAYFAKNEDWLFPYACFSYLRDFYKIADISKWRAHRTYDKKELETLIASDPNAKHAVELTYFTQYLLHKQLSEVKKYVNQHGIALKGDIPIGVSRNSVDVWTHPHLFNLDTQTGAPPDDFSITGQNWEFPTYNWEEMEKDGYRWWIKRFRKMADYFDAYRIDHLLGFFRIWEIPASSIHSTLGYFSPALPLSVDEINEFGIKFDEEKMAKPYIDQQLLEAAFGEHAQEVIAKYLNKTSSKCFELKEEYNTQVKIRENFGDVLDAEAMMVREVLYSLCSQVLFVRDKRQTDKFHPRICGNKSNAYKNLSDDEKLAFDLLYENFYEHRHTEFWRYQALKKLPALISSTEMLACGEDLGMVPNSVPSVMKKLKLLSLEIERMPKTPKVPFENLAKLPYLSVCATSSHDITPIRAWWLESKENTQIYYNEVLGKKGIAPKECSTEICSQILANHLNSPSMLAVFPLQDWMSIDVNVRRANPADDRINKPGLADGCWRYRMHVTLEELVKAEGLNKKIVALVEKSGRA